MGNIVAFEEMACEGISEPAYKAARVEALIKLAEQTVESITGRLFYKRDLTIYADGSGKELLPLWHPALVITAIEVDSVALAAEDYEIEVDPISEAALFRPQLRRLGDNVWSKGSRNIKIVGSFGHVFARGTDPQTYEAPQLVKRAIMRMVVYNLAQLSTQVATSGRGEVIREKLGNAEFQYREGTASTSGWSGDSEILQMLARYRRLRMASV